MKEIDGIKIFDCGEEVNFNLFKMGEPFIWGEPNDNWQVTIFDYAVTGFEQSFNFLDNALMYNMQTV